MELVRGDGTLQDLSGWFAPFLEAWYKCIGIQLKQEGFNSVLEVAGGIAPRGFDMARDPTVTYVDTDLDGRLGERKNCWRQLTQAACTGKGHGHDPAARSLGDAGNINPLSRPAIAELVSAAAARRAPAQPRRAG